MEESHVFENTFEALRVIDDLTGDDDNKRAAFVDLNVRPRLVEPAHESLTSVKNLTVVDDVSGGSCSCDVGGYSSGRYDGSRKEEVRFRRSG